MRPGTGTVKRLHLLLSASVTAVRDCVGQFESGDHILLVDAGANLLADEERMRGLSQACGTAVRALEADVRARGLVSAAKRQGVQLIADSAWVALVADHSLVLSWK